MNQVLIFFVPTGATQQDFEAALREYLQSLEIYRNQKQSVEPDSRTADDLPLWTWFLPNPCR
jgi:hypothetical protein